MNILITGSTGYVGSIIFLHLKQRHKVFGVSSRCASDENHIQCDLTDKAAVIKLADLLHPDVVIHAAGNKNIDYCERNPDKAFSINCDSVRHVAAVFGKTSKIIYISTDYVFDGQRGQYKETDIPKPATIYGKSKLCGEVEGNKIAQANFIVIRLSALYDMDANYPRYLYDTLSRKNPVTCYADAIYSPTYFKDLLRIIEAILEMPIIQNNVFHCSGESTTRYDFARTFSEIFEFDSALIRKANGKINGSFYQPDLSMNNEYTRLHLHTTRTPMRDAFQELKRGINNENTGTLQEHSR